MWHKNDELYRPQPCWSNHHCTRIQHHYENNGIETLHTSGNSFIDIDHHQDHIYYPFSYIMIDDNVQEQDHHHHHHYTFPQILMNRPLPPPTPEPSTLTPLMLSSPPIPDSYNVHQPFTPMMQQSRQPSLLPLAPESSLAVGCSTIQQRYQQRINYYDYSERSSEEAATKMIKNDSPSTCLSRLHLGERTIDNSMKSTVIFNKNTYQQQTSNNINKLSEQANEIKTQFEITLDEDKVVDVCKRTILAAFNKVIINNFESALFKLRKTIRILDVLMFDEGGSKIRAKIDTVGPWLETLKDMERKIKQNQQNLHNNGSHDPDNSEKTRSEDGYNNQLRQLTNNRSSRNNSINNENGGLLNQFWWKSNLRRYRTTGKIIVEQHRCKCYTNRRRYRRNNPYL